MLASKYNIDRRRTTRRGRRKQQQQESSSEEDPESSPPVSRKEKAHRQSATRSRFVDQPEGGILANFASPRSSAIKAREKLTRMSKAHESKDGSDDHESDHTTESSGQSDDEEASYVQEESEYEEEEETEAEEPFQRQSLRSNRRTRKAHKPKRKKRTHSSDDEFIVDEEEEEEEEESLVEDDSDANISNEEEEMFGDPDLSEEETISPRKGRHDRISQKTKTKRDGRKHRTLEDSSVDEDAANIDDEQIGTIDDDSSDDDDDDDKKGDNLMRSSTEKTEILPSPRGSTNRRNAESDDESTKAASTKASRVRCPVCPSKEDAITLEPLPRLHVCYISPDGSSRQCFNLETLRQIALKSSHLQLRVDLDKARQNFLQPPAFRTSMSDDLVDQIASKFGRTALDLHGPYYTNRHKPGFQQQDVSHDDDFHYASHSSDDENIYDSIEAFRDRVKDYFRKGMGSQDVYVCPLCYGQLHRNISNPNSDKEQDDVPRDSNFDPMTILGHLDNDEMSIASQFCFKKLVDVKRHLREDHCVDTKGIQGNELYQQFRVRAPDGLLQRWLRTQVRGQVKQGHMVMYWNQGYDQVFVELLNFMERARVHDKSIEETDRDDDDSEANDKNEFDEYAEKARDFYDTFAKKAFHHWTALSSPFLKSGDNMRDFIKDDNATDEEEYIEEDEEKPSFSHRQLMNSMQDDSDENDLVHKLQRKYAERNDYDGNLSSSSEEELANEKNAYGTLNGYYSPIEEEEDEWMLQHQRRRKRKSTKATSSEGKTPAPRKRLVRHKSTTPVATSARKSSTPSASTKKRMLALQDSSDEEQSYHIAESS